MGHMGVTYTIMKGRRNEQQLVERKKDGDCIFFFCSTAQNCICGPVRDTYIGKVNL